MRFIGVGDGGKRTDLALLQSIRPGTVSEASAVWGDTEVTREALQYSGL